MNEMVEKLLTECGAILRGHFRLSSGRHSDIYFEKFRILERPEVLGPLCGSIASQFFARQVEFVVGPTLGGVLVAYEVARHLGAHALYLERDEGRRTLRRGAQLPAGSSVLVVDDVLTTGLSLVESIDCVRDHRAHPIGAAVLIDRSSAPVQLKAPVVSLWRTGAADYASDDCPMCRTGLPLTSPGSRHCSPSQT